LGRLLRRHRTVVGIVIAVVLIGSFLLARSHSKSNCVTHQLDVAGPYTSVGIAAALRVYPREYSGSELAPSVNEIVYARGICGENP
jgi:hypothetical protein